MLGMDGWDLAVIAVASYVALVALARLMLHRRDEIVNELTEQVKEARRRRKSERQRARRRQRQEKARQQRQDRDAA